MEPSHAYPVPSFDFLDSFSYLGNRPDNLVAWHYRGFMHGEFPFHLMQVRMADSAGMHLYKHSAGSRVRYGKGWFLPRDSLQLEAVFLIQQLL